MEQTCLRPGLFNGGCYRGNRVRVTLSETQNPRVFLKSQQTKSDFLFIPLSGTGRWVGSNSEIGPESGWVLQPRGDPWDRGAEGGCPSPGHTVGTNPGYLHPVWPVTSRVIECPSLFSKPNRRFTKSSRGKIFWWKRLIFPFLQEGSAEGKQEWFEFDVSRDPICDHQESGKSEGGCDANRKGEKKKVSL